MGCPSEITEDSLYSFPVLFGWLGTEPSNIVGSKSDVGRDLVARQSRLPTAD